MRNIKLYPLKVLVSFLFVFVLLGAELSMFAAHTALHISSFETVINQQALEEKAYEALESYFQSRSNSTGIPAEIYLDAIDKNDLQQGISASVANGFAYLHGKSETYTFTMDFTELETAVRQFFSDYADENHISKDAVYEEKVDAAIEEAEAEIVFIVDTFKLTTMYENGWLTKIRTYIHLLDKAAVALTVLAVILCILLFVISKGTEGFYWTGISACTAGILTGVPSIYIKVSDYVSGFVVKDQQIFAAVVGYLQFLTNREIFISCMTVLIGIICLLLFRFITPKSDNG